MATEEEVAIQEELLVYDRRGLRTLGMRHRAVVVVVAAVAATAVWYANRSAPQAPVTVTYSGSAVDGAAQLIANVDRAFAQYVSEQHGARASNSRCYFDRLGGWAATDVAPTLFCGPVIFYGGAAPDLWLRYVLSPSRVAGGHYRLLAASHPETRAPVALRVGAQLERPDRRDPPTGADGLVAPGPPPAKRDVIARIKPREIPSLPAMPATSIIGGRNVGIRLIAAGFVPRYGRGLGIRLAPAGEELLAFELAISQGEVNDLEADLTAQPPSVGLAVNGGHVRPLPIPTFVYYATSAGPTRYIVTAVPTGVRQVDLVVTDGGITQRLSLLTGAPAAGNIAVLARDPKQLYGRATSSRSAPATVVANSATLAMNVSTPYLGYFSPYGPEHASGADRALLNVSVSFVTPKLTCPGSSCGFSFRARNFALIPSGGEPIRPTRMSNGYFAFDVPASFRTGTVTITGSTRVDGATVTLIHPYRLTIVFPK